MEDGIPRLRRANSKSSLMTPDEKTAASQTRRTATTGIAIAALILALLGCALALGLGIGYGRGNSGDIQNLRGDVDQLWSEVVDLRDNATAQNATIQELQVNLTVQYQALHSEIMLLQAQFVDGLMNVSGGNGGGGGGPGYTMRHVQNGTFRWEDNFGQSIQSTFSDDVIVFGPLSFQLLTLNPPSTPLIINPANGGQFFFYLNNFNPVISQLVLQGPTEAFVPLTATNAAKMNVTNDQGCFNNFLAPFPPPPVKRKRQFASICYERSRSSGPYAQISRNSLYAHVDSNGGSFFFGGIIEYPPLMLDGQGFTLTLPWQLVLAAF